MITTKSLSKCFFSPWQEMTWFAVWSFCSKGSSAFLKSSRCRSWKWGSCRKKWIFSDIFLSSMWRVAFSTSRTVTTMSLQSVTHRAAVLWLGARLKVSPVVYLHTSKMIFS